MTSAALPASTVCATAAGYAVLNDAWGKRWWRVAPGREACDLPESRGNGFGNVVKPRSDYPSKTLRAMQGTRGYHTFAHPREPRALSVEEAMAIMSFPPAFQIVGSYVERWRQVGNAVPPLLARAVGRHLRAVEGVVVGCRSAGGPNPVCVLCG